MPNPLVYNAVRAVGRLVPEIDPNHRTQNRVFAEKLEVLGTAFWLKEQRVLVTCAHVIADLIGAPIGVAGLLVIGNRGNYLPAKIGMVDFDHDLAILRLPQDSPEQLLETEANTGLEIVTHDPDIGSGVAYAGFPLGMQLLQVNHEPTYSEGVVAAKRDHKIRKQIQITGAVVGGFSGAPITLKNNPAKVIGVLSNSTSRQAGEANIFLGISWEHLLKIAELGRM